MQARVLKAIPWTDAASSWALTLLGLHCDVRSTRRHARLADEALVEAIRQRTYLRCGSANHRTEKSNEDNVLWWAPRDSNPGKK